MLLLCGCTNNKNKEYRYGVISSYYNDSYSRLIMIDEDMNIVDTDILHISQMGQYGYGVPQKVGDKVYILTLGRGSDSENCSIFCIDTGNNKTQNYKFKDRVLITDYYVDEKGICVISNLNRETFVDYYSFETNKISTYKFDGTAIDMAVCQGKIYIISMDIDEYLLWLVDIDKSEATQVLDLSPYCINENGEEKGSVYYEEYNNYLYIPIYDELLKINTNDYSVYEIELPITTNIFGSYKSNGKLYISSSDIHSEYFKSSIIVMDLETEEIEHVYKTDDSIQEFIVDGDNLVLLNCADELVRYKMDGDDLIFVNKINLQEQGYDYLSAIYAK